MTLRGHGMVNKILVAKFFLAQSLSHLLTDFDRQKISMNAYIIKTQIFHKMIYDLKGHIRPLLCYGEVICFLIKSNLNLRSHGHLLSLFLYKLNC